MGMKPKSENKAVPPIPSVPLAVKPVQPLEKKEKAGDDRMLSDRMTKQAPVDARSASIERQAIIKSVLESPMLAQLIVGLPESQALPLFERVFNKAIEVFYGEKK